MMNTLRGPISSTILGTRGDDLPAWQRESANEPEAGFVARAAELHREGLADASFEIGLAQVADAEKARRRSLDLPGLHLAFVGFDVDGQVGVRISPIHLGQSAVQSDAIVEV